MTTVHVLCTAGHQTIFFVHCYPTVKPFQLPWPMLFCDAGRFCKQNRWLPVFWDFHSQILIFSSPFVKICVMSRLFHGSVRLLALNWHNHSDFIKQITKGLKTITWVWWKTGYSSQQNNDLSQLWFLEMTHFYTFWPTSPNASLLLGLKKVSQGFQLGVLFESLWVLKNLQKTSLWNRRLHGLLLRSFSAAFKNQLAAEGLERWRSEDLTAVGSLGPMLWREVFVVLLAGSPV